MSALCSLLQALIHIKGIKIIAMTLCALSAGINQGLEILPDDIIIRPHLADPSPIVFPDRDFPYLTSHNGPTGDGQYLNTMCYVPENKPFA